jgi:DivIVA domain-containing protein
VISFVVFVVGVLVVGGLLFLVGSVLLGRGETQPPAELDRSPMELPDDRPVTGDDVRALRISPAVRGYRMTEVDWLLDQFAQTLDERDEEIAALRARLAGARPSPHPHRAPEERADERREEGPQEEPEGEARHQAPEGDRPADDGGPADAAAGDGPDEQS